MTSNNKFLHATIATAIALGSSFAHASPIAGTTSGLASASTIITFDDPTFAPDTIITTQYASYGVTFGPGLYYSPADPDAVYGYTSINGNTLSNYYSGQSFDDVDAPAISPITIRFATTQTAVAFGLAANGTSFTFTAFLDGVSVESFTSVVDDAYYGFSGMAFDSIGIASNQAPSDFFNFDNLQFTAAAAGPGDTNAPNAPNAITVPEPDAVALLGLGLLGALSVRRRSRKAA